jgi:hypothetical protein
LIALRPWLIFSNVRVPATPLNITACRGLAIYKSRSAKVRKRALANHERRAAKQADSIRNKMLAQDQFKLQKQQYKLEQERIKESMHSLASILSLSLSPLTRFRSLFLSAFVLIFSTIHRLCGGSQPEGPSEACPRTRGHATSRGSAR